MEKVGSKVFKHTCQSCRIWLNVEHWRLNHIQSMKYEDGINTKGYKASYSVIEHLSQGWVYMLASRQATCFPVSALRFPVFLPSPVTHHGLFQLWLACFGAPGGSLLLDFAPVDAVLATRGREREREKREHNRKSAIVLSTIHSKDEFSLQLAIPFLLLFCPFVLAPAVLASQTSPSK